MVRLGFLVTKNIAHFVVHYVAFVLVLASGVPYRPTHNTVLVLVVVVADYILLVVARVALVGTGNDGELVLTNRAVVTRMAFVLVATGGVVHSLLSEQHVNVACCATKTFPCLAVRLSCEHLVWGM